MSLNTSKFLNISFHRSHLYGTPLDLVSNIRDFGFILLSDLSFNSHTCYL